MKDLKKNHALQICYTFTQVLRIKVLNHLFFAGSHLSQFLKS